MSRFLRWLRINQASIDELPYLHPRPVRDPRIVSINLMMIYICIVQVLKGPGPTSINARAFEDTTNAYYLGLLGIASAFILAAAVVKDEYKSMALELVGSIGAVFVYGIFAWAASQTVRGWDTTQSTGWAIAFTAGSAVRLVQLVRKIW